MQCKFWIGQKVVSIADTWGDAAVGFPYQKGIPQPIKGNIYTVSGFSCIGNIVGISVKEIPHEEAYWDHKGFKPLHPNSELAIDKMKKTIENNKPIIVETPEDYKTRQPLKVGDGF